MATQISSAEGTTPFDLLGQKISAAVRTKGTIKLSSNIIEKIRTELKKFQRSNTSVPDTYVIKLVHLLDMQEHSCSRMETTTFIIILETILHAPFSQEKERAIYLLAESIYYDCHKRSTSRVIEARKAAIGKTFIHRLINCFTNATGNAHSRRWIGVMILELLDSEETRNAFQVGPEHNKRNLGTMVVEEGNEILRIICGQILKVLLASDMTPKDLWPMNADPSLFAGFPLSSQKDNHWNNAFQKYIDQLFNSSDSLQSDAGRLYFVQAMITNQHEIRFSGCTISLFINDEVSICTQSHCDSFMECLDIPLALISEVAIAETIFETEEDDGLDKVGSQIKDAVDLLILLRASGESSCYFNAAPANILEIRLTISKEELADTIGAEILDEVEKLDRIKGEKISQSKETIEVVRKVNTNRSITEISRLESPHVLEAPAVSMAATYDANIESVEDLVRERHTQYVNPKDIQYCNNQISEPYFEPVVPLQKTKSSTLQLLPVRTHDNYTRKSLPETANPESGSNIYEQRIEHISIVQNERSENDNQHIDLDCEEAQHNAQWANRASCQTISIPRTPGQFHTLNGAESMEGGLPPSLANSARIANRPTGTKKRSANVALNKPKSSNLKPPNQRRRKPGLIPKKSYGKLKTTFPRDFSGSVPNKEKKEQESLLLNHETSGKSIEIKEKSQTCSPRSPPRILVQSLHRVEKVVSNSTINEMKQSLSKYSQNHDISVAAGNLPNSFGPKLRDVVEVIDNSEDSQARQTRPSPQPISREDQTENIIIANKTSCSCVHQASEPELHEFQLPRQQLTEMTKVQRQCTKQPAQKDLKDVYSPTLISNTLNQVLANNKPLVNEKSARKTPIVSFSAKGPLNQGFRRTEIPSVTQKHKVETQANSLVAVEDQSLISQGKRKRAVEIPMEMEISELNQPSKLQKSYAVTSSHSRQALPPAFQDEHDTISSNASLAEQSHPVFGLQRSRVDEKGSPIASDLYCRQRKSFQDIAEKSIRNGRTYNRNGASASKCLHHKVEDGVSVVIQAACQAVPSISLKSWPYQANERSKASSTVIQNSPMRVIDERTLPGCMPQKESFMQRLKIAKSGARETLPILPDESMVQYLSCKRIVAPKKRDGEDDTTHTRRDILGDPFEEKGLKIELTASIPQNQNFAKEELIHQPTAISMGAKTIQVQADMFGDPEVTLVNVENPAVPEDKSSLSDSTDCTSNLFQGTEAPESSITVETLEDEWRMALKSHQKGVLDVLYQISKDLVRYLISHEEAVTDVLNDYLRSGTKLVEELEEKHQKDRRRIRHGIETAKNNMRKSLTDHRQQLVHIVHDIEQGDLNITEKTWRSANEQLEKMIEAGRKHND